MRLVTKNKEEADRIAEEYEMLGWHVEREGTDLIVNRYGPKKPRNTKPKDTRPPRRNVDKPDRS